MQVHVFEATENGATRAAAEELRQAIAEARRYASTNALADGGRALTEALDRLEETAGVERSALCDQQLFALAEAAQALGDLESEHRAWQRVTAFRAQALPAGHPHTRFAFRRFGDVLRENGEFDEARALYVRELETLSTMLPPEHADLLSLQNGLALALRMQGDLPGARAIQERVLEAASGALPLSHPDVQVARANLASTMSMQGDLEGARNLEEQILSECETALPPDHPTVQASRTNLAVTLIELGHLERASSLLKLVLEARRRTLPPDHPQLYTTMMNLGAVMVALGDPAPARTLLDQALEGLSALFSDDHPHVVLAQHSLATALFRQGDLDRARTLTEQTLEVLSRTGSANHPLLHKLRGNLANVLIEQGEIESARELLERALESCRATLPRDHPDRWLIGTSLAVTARRQGDLQRAQTMQESLLEQLAANFPDDHPYLTGARENLAVTLYELGEFTRAGDLLETVFAARARRLHESHPDLQQTRSNLAAWWASAGDVAASQRFARDLAGAALSGIRSSAGLSVREFEAAVDLQAIDRALSYAAGLGRFASDPSGEELAFSLCEAVRATPLELARVLRAVERSPEARAIREQLRTAQRRLSGSLAADAGRVDFADAVMQRDRLERQLFESLAADGSAEQISPASSPEAIAAALRPDEVAVAYWKYERWFFRNEPTRRQATEICFLLWSVHPNGTWRRIELGPAQAIERAIEQWRGSLGAPTREITGRRRDEEQQESARRLASLLLGEVMPDLEGARRVWLLPARELHRVAFDALPVPETAERNGPAELLGDRHEFVQLSSLSELRSRRPVEAPADQPGPQLLAMGGIRYDLPRTAGMDDDAERPPADRGRGAFVHTGSSSSAEANYSFRFGPLPFSRSEAAIVTEYFHQCFEGDHADATLLIGSEATREQFEDLAPHSRFLHLATHGWFAAESVPCTTDPRPIDEHLGLGSFSDLRSQVRGMAPSLLCGLAFAGANGDADVYGRVHGVMTAEELRGLDLSGCELAVLSACETHVGADRRGQGIASLQSALHAAGVRTAITSLWRVPDDVTQELMTEFYRRVWLLGESKPKALWEAKSAIRSQVDADGEPLYGPYHWAGWVLSGSPD